MSDARFLLLFLGEASGWLRLADGRVVARGEALEAIPFPDDDESDENIVAVIPGSHVALHWVELPATLAPAQAQGAARLMAGDVSAEPVDNLHVSVGRAFDDEDERCMALLSGRHMDKTLAQCQALGLDPDHVVPEPALLAAPDEGVRLFRRGGLDNVRGYRSAFAAEAELAALLLTDETIETTGAEAFEAGLSDALAALPVDLRQGRYAKRHRWKTDWSFVRRLALLGASILLVTLLIQLTLITRYSFAADAVERETAEIARDALPGNSEITDPQVQLRQRLASVGGGPGYSVVASALFGAVQRTNGTELQSLIYNIGGGAQITIAAPSQVEIDTFQQDLAGAGLIVTPGAVRDAAGSRIAEFGVTAP